MDCHLASHNKDDVHDIILGCRSASCVDEHNTELSCHPERDDKDGHNSALGCYLWDRGQDDGCDRAMQS